MNINDKLWNYTAQDLNQRITMLKLAVTRDDEGNRVRTYADLRTVWAAVEPLTSLAEATKAAEPVNSITYQILVRYASAADLTQGDRISYQGHTLKVSGPPVDLRGRHKYLVFEAVQLVEVV